MSCPAVGEDPQREGCVTLLPGWRDAQEMLLGCHRPGEILETTFDENHDELVLVKDIPLYSI